MNLSSVEVRNYKSLNSCRISDFNKINMLFGFNNCGKSNLLKFLNLIFKKRSFSQDIEVSEVDSTGIEIRKQDIKYTDFWSGNIYNSQFIYKDSSSPIVFKITLEVEPSELTGYDEIESYVNPAKGKSKQTNIIHLCIKGRIVSLNIYNSQILLDEVNINNKQIYENNNGEKFFKDSKKLNGNRLLFENLINKFNDAILFLDTNRYVSFEKEIKNVKSEGPQVFKNLLYKMFLNHESYNEFKKFLSFIKTFTMSDSNYDVDSPIKKILSNNIKSFPLSNGELGFTVFENDELELMLENNVGRLPLRNFGTGIQQILYILSRLFRSKSRIVLIEELELNLSHKLQFELLKFLKSLIDNKIKDQIIFTTHSNYFCRNTNLVSSLFEAKIDENGNTTFSKATNVRATSYFDVYYK